MYWPKGHAGDADNKLVFQLTYLSCCDCLVVTQHGVNIWWVYPQLASNSIVPDIYSMFFSLKSEIVSNSVNSALQPSFQCEV